MPLTCEELKNLNVPIYFTELQSEFPTITDEVEKAYNENQVLLEYYIKRLINCKNIKRATEIKKVKDNETTRFEKAKMKINADLEAEDLKRRLEI